MKTILRTLIILFFAALVVAGVYAISTTAWANELAPSGKRLGSGEGIQDDSLSDEEGLGQGRRRGQGGAGGEHVHYDMEGTVNSFTLIQFLKTLIPLAIIIVVVNLIRKTLDTVRKKRRRSATQT
ncbi:MAG: hypothetical protein PVF83_13515 [Anaerolineales bacterium]|jgi:hypothetical protein